MGTPVSTNTDAFKVIAKLEDSKVLLFFPEVPANFACIQCWDGQHSEATIGYFWQLRAANNQAEVGRVVKQYEKLHQCKLQLVKRDSMALKKLRWAKFDYCNLSGDQY